MSPETQTLKFEQRVEAPAPQVYRAFTNGTALREWFCDVSTVDPKPGGRFYVYWNAGFYAAGEYTEVQSDEKVAFTFNGRGYPASTQVQVAISSRNGETLVTLEQSGVGQDDAWTNIVGEIKRGWEGSLENLASVLETGRDLRFVRRPMLGITISDFNAEIAEKHGIPVTEGIRLDDLVEDMGAEKAGLQSGDVVVEIAGRPVTDWGSLDAALQVHRAGDSVEVVFYRGSEKERLDMELSGRPLPEIVWEPAALAEEARKRYTQIEAELERFFKDVSEEQAASRPAPDEWSAKDTLAHLIHGERGWQQWVGDMVGGHQPFYDDWGGNIPARNAATLTAFSTLAELIAELKRLHRESSALLANLPADFVARKGTYWFLAYRVLEDPYHFYTHLDQMRAAVESTTAANVMDP
jgi:uncharacterized protein YndB with AHSA1/START domain